MYYSSKFNLQRRLGLKKTQLNYDNIVKTTDIVKC